MSDNQNVSSKECRAIRQLSDFDLTMLLSELHDHGWLHARTTLRMMPDVEDQFDDLPHVRQQAAQSERELLQPKSMPAWPMIQAVLEAGCVPLLLIGGKEIGGGFRDYVIAGAPGMTTEHVAYLVERLPLIQDGTLAKEAENN